MSVGVSIVIKELPITWFANQSSLFLAILVRYSLMALVGGFPFIFEPRRFQKSNCSLSTIRDGWISWWISQVSQTQTGASKVSPWFFHLKMRTSSRLYATAFKSEAFIGALAQRLDQWNIQVCFFLAPTFGYYREMPSKYSGSQGLLPTNDIKRVRLTAENFVLMKITYKEKQT
jgi:hypothetical protein